MAQTVPPPPRGSGRAVLCPAQPSGTALSPASADGSRNLRGLPVPPGLVCSPFLLPLAWLPGSAGASPPPGRPPGFLPDGVCILCTRFPGVRPPPTSPSFTSQQLTFARPSPTFERPLSLEARDPPPFCIPACLTVGARFGVRRGSGWPPSSRGWSPATPLRTPWRLHEAAWPQGAAWSHAGGARARRTRFSGGRRLRSQPRGGSEASREPGPVPLAQTAACRDLLTGLLRPEGLPPVEAGRTVFTPPPLSLSPSREAEPPCTPWLQPEPGVVRCDTSPPVTRSPLAGPLSPGCKARCGPAGTPSAAQPAGRPPSPHGHGPRRTCARAASTARPPGRLPELRPGPQRAPCPVATSAQPRADGARARPDWPSVPAPRVTGTETWAPSAVLFPRDGVRRREFAAWRGVQTHPALRVTCCGTVARNVSVERVAMPPRP